MLTSARLPMSTRTVAFPWSARSSSTFDCVVRNLSDSGAAFEVASSLGIPVEFRLAVLNEFERPSRATRIKGGPRREV